jgi:16S rRNA (adenine1518-N6/adenine1519-N6)-dimethyltransferase
MKLSAIKQVLAEHGIKLTKSLGQNFLHDGNQLRRIVATAELQPDDKVLEIGPGLGPLTQPLLEAAGEVLAIEKDRRLAEILRQQFADSDHLTLLCDDALEHVRSNQRDWSDWKLVANLPYSVASPIIVELAQAGGCPERIVVTLQREVAQRLVAKPGDEDYGLLTLLVQLRYAPRGWFKIPARCFFPTPEVDSACVTLIRRPEPLLDEKQSEVFTQIVKRAFSQRRKMMFKLLKQDWPESELTLALERLSISHQTRAETISLQQFVELARHLHRYA